MLRLFWRAPSMSMTFLRPKQKLPVFLSSRSASSAERPSGERSKVYDPAGAPLRGVFAHQQAGVDQGVETELARSDPGVASSMGKETVSGQTHTGRPS